MKKLILIDGNSLINRAFYATPLMSNSKGEPTNAVLGFTNMLLKLINDVKPEYILVAFDRKEPTFRHVMYKEYKAQRKPMPEELRPQIPTLKKLLEECNIKYYDKPGSEADDIIGTVAKNFGVETIIVTGDRDSFQLVDETTTVYFTKRGISDLDVLNIENFKEKTSLSPSQIIDLKALMGDKSDNIPGIPGVGEKTAMDLILNYGTIEGVYENLNNLKGKLKEKVEQNEDICKLSKVLATIDTNVDTGLSLDDMKFKFPLPSSAKHFLSQLEFRTILNKKEIFEEIDLQPSEDIPTPSEIVVVSALNNLPDFSNKTIALNLNSNSLSLSEGRVEYKAQIKENFFDDGFTYDDILNLLKKIFENENQKVILFSRKKVEHTLKEYGISLVAKVEDVSLKKYIADFTGTEETIESIALYYDLPENYPAFSLFKSNALLDAKLEENGQYSLYKYVELPLAKVLFEMETAGFRVDEKIIDELNEKYKEIISDLTKKIHNLAGEEFNVNSPKQLARILFEKLKLNYGKKKKGNPSTSAEVLEEISDQHEIVPLILQYRRIFKLNSTYVEGFKPLIERKTGLIHTVFNQTLTTTGRLSSKEPNLQNLPIRDEDGKEIRKFFIPSDNNHVLVGADYSQIELRLLAHYSESEILINAYKQGLDIHTITASQVFGVNIDEVTKAMRQSAKAVNFGIIYGISEYGLAKNLKILPKQAKAYIDRYFESYPSVKEYMDSNVKFARENGFVSTLCGRKRYIRDINSSNYNLRQFSERAAMNMPLQGSSADIIKIAMVRVYDRLKNEGLSSKLILQVHDELIIDTLISEKEQVEKLLKEEMENAITLKVPLVAEVYSGKNLSEAK